MLESVVKANHSYNLRNSSFFPYLCKIQFLFFDMNFILTAALDAIFHTVTHKIRGITEIVFGEICVQIEKWKKKKNEYNWNIGNVSMLPHIVNNLSRDMLSKFINKKKRLNKMPLHRNRSWGNLFICELKQRKLHFQRASATCARCDIIKYNNLILQDFAISFLFHCDCNCRAFAQEKRSRSGASGRMKND